MSKTKLLDEIEKTTKKMNELWSHHIYSSDWMVRLQSLIKKSTVIPSINTVVITLERVDDCWILDVAVE